jgi:hypothetical protein
MSEKNFFTCPVCDRQLRPHGYEPGYTIRERQKDFLRDFVHLPLHLMCTNTKCMVIGVEIERQGFALHHDRLTLGYDKESILDIKWRSLEILYKLEQGH